MTMTNPPRPGYWLANDGKWYPPELHPDRIRERLAAERGATASAATTRSTREVNGGDETSRIFDGLRQHPSIGPLDSAPQAEYVGPADATFEPEPPKVETAEVETSEPDVFVAETATSELVKPEITEPEITQARPAIDNVKSESLESRWARRSEATVPVEDGATTSDDVADTVDSSTDVAPTLPAVEPLPVVETPVVETPVAETPVAEAPVVETPVAEAPVAEPPAAVQPAPEVAPTPAPTQQAAAAPPPRAPIAEPFPEADEDNLLEAEPQKSFLRRWWLPMLLFLGALALINWVIMPYINTDAASDNDNELDVFALDAGTCIDLPDLADLRELKGTVARVPCSQSHSHEVFHTVNHASAPFDQSLVKDFAETECLNMFESYTGEVYDRSQLNFILLLPNEKAWDKGDRTTICVLFGDGPLTESARS